MIRTSEKPGLYVVIEGAIAAGKTTFARRATQVLQAQYPEVQFLEEPVDINPFLQPFLSDMRRWAFSLQVYFLNYRFMLHRQAQLLRVTGRAGILDRCVWLDVAFARLGHKLGNLTDSEIEVYEMMRINILDYLNYPDLVIWLDIPPDQQMNRIHKRARPGEPTGYTIPYLEGLQEQYEISLESLGQHTVIHRVQWSDFDDAAIESQVPYVLQSALKRIRKDWTGRQGW